MGFDHPYYLTFFDMDGGNIDDGNDMGTRAVYEMTGVEGATEVVTDATQSTIAQVIQELDQPNRGSTHTPLGTARDGAGTEHPTTQQHAPSLPGLSGG